MTSRRCLRAGRAYCWAGAFLFLLTACGSGSVPETEADGSGTSQESVRTITFDRSAQFADPGGTPDQAWVDQITEWLEDYDADAASRCPVGDVTMFLDPLGPREAEVPLESGTDAPGFDIVDMVEGVGPGGSDEGSCRVGHGGGGVHVDFSYVPDAESGASALELFGTNDVGGFSEPQPFLGGEAWTRCYVNSSTELEVCGGGWFYQGLFLTTSLFLDPGADSQYAADWFGTVLPALAGAEPVAAASVDATPGSRLSGVADIDLLNGYSVQIDYDLGGFSAAKSTEHDSPGYATAVFSDNGSYSLTNTTDGHELKFLWTYFSKFSGEHFPGALAVVGIYGLDSWPCTAPSESEDGTATFYDGRHTNPDTCAVPVSVIPLSELQEAPYAPGETRDLFPAGHVGYYSGELPTDPVTGATTLGFTVPGIPEDEWDQATSDFENPLAWNLVFFRGYPDDSDGTRLLAVWDGSNADGPFPACSIIASTSPGIGC